MAEQTGAANAVLTRGFLPGLVLGIVVGAVVVFLGTEVIGKKPKIEIDPHATPSASRGEYEEQPTPSIDELERQAREAAQQTAKDGAPAEPAAENPAEPPEGDG